MSLLLDSVIFDDARISINGASSEVVTEEKYIQGNSCRNMFLKVKSFCFDIMISLSAWMLYKN